MTARGQSLVAGCFSLTKFRRISSVRRIWLNRGPSRPSRPDEASVICRMAEDDGYAFDPETESRPHTLSQGSSRQEPAQRRGLSQVQTAKHAARRVRELRVHSP